MRNRERRVAKSYFFSIAPNFGARLTLLVVLLGFVRPGLARADVLGDLASPVSTPALTPLLIGSGLTLALILVDDHIDDPLQQETAEDHPLGKFSKVGDYGGRLIPNAGYIAGMLIGSAAGNENAMNRAKEMALASIYACSVSSILKVTAREPRPNDGTDHQSFPSGHATAAFAFASVVGAEHGLGWGIPAYALASLVAYSRMNDNRHYLHDVVAGATIGTAYGLGIYYRHHDPKTGRTALLVPAVNPTHLGLQLTYAF